VAKVLEKERYSGKRAIVIRDGELPRIETVDNGIQVGIDALHCLESEVGQLCGRDMLVSHQGG
jgi:hypothetical protein